MSEGSWGIEVRGLTKTFGPVAAVTDLSFGVAPGTVAGFLGPNGAGKTTTMRMLLGLVAPTSGTATIGGRRYADLARPTATVGAVLDGSGFHPGHTALDHLRVYARMGRYGTARAARVAELTGVSAFAGRATRTLSTGMRQRLNLATALLGDPRVLLLDEPGNGLDPEGIAWLRRFLLDLAAEGRTVLVSSHVLGEIEQVADQVVVIREGRLVATGPITGLYGAAAVLVRSPEADLLRARLLDSEGEAGGVIRVEAPGPGVLRVHGMTTAQVAAVAAAHGIPLHEITLERPTLEEAFLNMTGGAR
ncbi:ATP-binding cassette domain-containing protein [Sphaerisporangium sp. NBC_01403]|uniref:ABC transporter ATP-binding protein n=1 Tax=Sphaerisporangium sp. NBC_01403 TaxID=2903599 RepID=UPI00325384DD